MSKSNLIPSAGVIPINKPAGPTSHDIVANIRRLLSTHYSLKTKVGHTGTLDPFATGLLPIAFGQATRLIEYAKDWPKTYLLTVKFGATSDTDDITGQIKNSLPLNKACPPTGRRELEGVQSSIYPTKKKIEGVLRQFTGTIKQIPPIYSAKKIQGKRLYKLARKSLSAPEIQKLAGDKTSTVTIYEIKIASYDYPNLTLKVTCGPGTYMRSLARDLGQALGTGGYAADLQRIKTGPIDINKSIQSDEINSKNLAQFILSPDILIQHLPRLTLSDVNVAKLKNGQAVEWGNALSGETTPDILPTKPIAIYDNQKQLIGIARFNQDSPLLSPIKILSNL